MTEPSSEANDKLGSNPNYDIETQQFMIKTLNICNKYRSNTNNEIIKRKEVNKELSSFLNASNEAMIKTINDYKEEMNSELISNNNNDYNNHNNNNDNNNNNHNNDNNHNNNDDDDFDIASLHIPPSPP